MQLWIDSSLKILEIGQIVASKAVFNKENMTKEHEISKEN